MDIVAMLPLGLKNRLIESGDSKESSGRELAVIIGVC
jgi:hypothetical protein